MSQPDPNPEIAGDRRKAAPSLQRSLTGALARGLAASRYTTTAGTTTDTVEGMHLWEGLTSLAALPTTKGFSEPKPMFGEPMLVRPRLGQGGFRVSVIQAYERRCVVTGEKTLPALEAAHIQSVKDKGTHETSNGLLLRRDLHALFDQHYLTITPDKTLIVSKRIREEFENGREYYALHGRRVRDPLSTEDYPSVEALRRHNDLFVE